MILFEDVEFEKATLADRCHIAVPFEVTESEEGVSLLVYSFCEKIAGEFESRFSADPFSAEARRFLAEQLTPIMNAMEYECVGACDHIHLVYRMEHLSEVNADLLPEPCESAPHVEILSQLSENDFSDSETDLAEFTIDEEDEMDRMAVIRGENGEIVCYAAVNDLSEDGDAYELTVECAEAYRERGYGSRCVAVLSRYLLDRGAKAVEYVSAEGNVPSTRLAEKVGFRCFKKCMPFVCYHIDSDRPVDEGIPF